MDPKERAVNMTGLALYEAAERPSVIRSVPGFEKEDFKENYSRYKAS